MELVGRRSTESPLQIEPAPVEPPVAAEPALAASAPPAEAKTPLEFIEEIGPEGMASFDQTFHGVALSGGAEGAVPGLFDETLPGSAADAGSRTYDQTLPGVPAAQLARDIGTADQPTPAAAQTVFTAGHARQSNPLYRWGLPAAGVIVLIAVGVFIHNVSTPVTPNTPSPWVARGIEAVPPPADPLLPPADASLSQIPPAGGEVVTQPAPEETVAGATAGTEPVPTAEPEATAVTAATPPEQAPVAAPETPAPETPVAAPGTPAPQAQPAPVAVAAAEPAAAPTPEAPPSLIRISRSRSASEHDRMVREAYSYYQAGDYESAAIHYLAVLNERPDTLDALLGMGAIALKQNDLPRAVEYFSQVLKIDPRNQTATAALIGLQRSPDPIASESALKVMLQENPDNPFLFFVLGNIYAAQSRWQEAQQAFFDAYRNDSANPDYALNLAASLDRLGQPQPALDYYNVALKLAENQAVGFDAAAVRARIQALSGAGAQTQ
jgi:Flp pilus assembly protein TadD